MKKGYGKSLSTLNICQLEVHFGSFREENGSISKSCWKDLSLWPWQAIDELSLPELYCPIDYPAVVLNFKLILIK